MFGDWEKPYLTMDPRFEAQQIRSLGKIISNGHLYRGLKPVHWCLDCRSALAEAEVEYEDRVSTAIDVAFRVVDAADFARRTGIAPAALAARPGTPASLVIWTTTPWTLPANEAVALNAGLDYMAVAVTHAAHAASALAVEGGAHAVEVLVLATELASACLQRYGAAEVHELAHFKGAALEGLTLQHPWLAKQVPVILGDHVTLEAGTGAVHTAPAHGQEDYVVGQRYGLPVVNPVQGDGRFVPGTELVEGLKVDDANAVIVAAACRTRPPAAPGAASAQLPALLASQDAGDLPRHLAVVHQHGSAGPARTCAARHPRREVDAGVGRGAHLRHDREAARLVPVAAAHLGRADHAVHAQGHAASGIRAAWN